LLPKEPIAWSARNPLTLRAEEAIPVP